MDPEIFLTDFEITENTESYHAILGRSLILATRFDNLCDHTAKFIKLKSSRTLRSIATEDQFEDFVNDLIGKYSSLNNNINGLPVPGEVKTILHGARKARNDIVHSMAIGWTGCMDTKVEDEEFKKQIIELVSKVAAGDITISIILSVLSKEPILNAESIRTYEQNIVNWVLDKENA